MLSPGQLRQQRSEELAWAGPQSGTGAVVKSAKSISKAGLAKGVVSRAKAKPAVKEASVAEPKAPTAAERVADLEDRVAALEQTLKLSRKEVRSFREKAEACEERLAGVNRVFVFLRDQLLTWANDVDAQRDEQDQALRNYGKSIGAHDTGPRQSRSLRSCLGILLDQGGAQPVDANARKAVQRG